MQHPPAADYNMIGHYPPRRTRKKALLIGINYSNRYPEGSRDKYGLKALRGCVNDVNDMRDLLVQQYDYHHEDIVVMADTSKYPQPTKANIEHEMHQLVSGAQMGDTLFFQFSGLFSKL